MTKTQQQEDLAFLFTQWFCIYANHPDRDHHFSNIKLVIKDDIKSGLLPEKSKALKDLREWYSGFELKLKNNEDK